MDFARAAAQAADIARSWSDEGGPGGALILFDRDGIRSEHAGGFADLEQCIAYAPDTLNRWASITKHIFCATLFRDGRIPFGDALGAHVSGLSPALAAVTVEDALGMSGGVPDLMETAWLLGVPPTAGTTIEGLRGFARRLTALNFAPGAEVSYTNTGYLLAETALEAKGTDFATALKTQFTGPLGLAMHYPTDYGVVVPGLAHGYWKADDGWRRGMYGMRFSASGGIAGSGRTLADWLRALLRNEGPTQGVLDWLSVPRALTSGAATDYARGLAVHKVGGTRLLGHGGSLPGYKDHFLLHQPSGTGLVVVCNREDVDPYLVALRVMLAGLGDALPPPADGILPAGLFAAEDGSPYWIENEGPRTTFLGAQQPMFRAPDGGAMTLSPYMAMALKPDGGGIAGHVGHVRRRFVRVEKGEAVPASWAGRYVLPAMGAALEVTVENGTATLHQGVGSLAASYPLEAIGANRALFRRADAQWAQRPCLHFTADGLRMVANRSRVLNFIRA